MWTAGDEEIDIETDAVTVEYGRHQVGDPKELNYRSEMYRGADRPVVNGVDLVGATVIHTNVMREQRLTGQYVNVRRPKQLKHGWVVH